MCITKLMVLAGLSLSVLAGPVLAQQNGGFTPQQLDEMSKQRMQELGPRNWGPPVPQSVVPKEDIRQPNELLVCMSADPWKNVYAAPNVSSGVIGKTLPEVAVKGATVKGFVPILFGPGRTGYVPAAEVRPFRSTVKPGATCTIAGVRPNGAAVFRMN
jgi:hypothetical protein